MLQQLADVVATLSVVALVYFLIRYRTMYETVKAAYGDAMQQVVIGSAQRRQAEMEFNNLKAVVDAWSQRPVQAMLSDQQVHALIQFMAGVIETQLKGLPKDPSRMD